MNEDAPAPDAPRYYELCLREGGPTMFAFRIKDKGVSLKVDGLEWYAGGGKAEKRYADIESIRLTVGNVPRSGMIGACRIAFRSGLVLLVTSSTQYGYADDDQNRLYADFLRDLHGRLSREDKRRIAFHAGETEGRRTFGLIAMVIAVLFFVALPLVLLVITGDTQALWITLAGGAFVWPLVKTMQRNEPRVYYPESLDESLFP